MSVNCEICGKDFKTTQGLRGHKTFVHQMTTTQDPPARLVTEQELSEVVDAVKQVVTLLKPIVDLHVKQLKIIENLTQYSHSIGEQVRTMVTGKNYVSSKVVDSQKDAVQSLRDMEELGARHI
jgi:hypothetical protein